MRFGGLEIVLVFAIVLLFFGPKQIPKLTSVLKESIASFKNDKKDAQTVDEIDESSESVKDDAVSEVVSSDK